MTQTAQSESCLWIGRWNTVYSVPPDLPDPEELRDRLDRLAESEIPYACTRLLEPLTNSADESVWLIRSLTLDFAIDAGVACAGQIAELWAGQLARVLRRVIDSGPDGNNVVRFGNRRAYIAQWAVDAAAGCVADKWYYAEFDSLRVLPASAAIAEALLREPDGPAAILSAVSNTARLDAILKILVPRDAERLWKRCVSEAQFSADGLRRWTSCVLALWRGTLAAGAYQPFHDALHLLAAARVEWPSEDTSALPQAIDALLNLRTALRRFASTEMAHRWLAALALGDQFQPETAALAEAAAQAGVLVSFELRSFVAEVSGGDPAWASFAAQIIAPSVEVLPAKGDSFLSELVGVFLLGPAFERLDIRAAAAAAAHRCERPVRAESLLLFLLGVRCLGRGRAALAIVDPAPRLFAGLDFVPTLSEMAETLAAADPAAALDALREILPEDEPLSAAVESGSDYFAIEEIFPELGAIDGPAALAWSRIAHVILRQFARQLIGFAQSSPEYIFQNFLAGIGSIHPFTERIEVRLGASPLEVVLRISGAYRNYSPAWHRGVEIWLRAPSD